MMRPAIFLVFLASFAMAGEPPAWPQDSAGEFSTFVALRRFQIYADHCSVGTPELKPGFESRLEDLNQRMQGIARGVLASDTFSEMRDKPVPAVIIAAFEDSTHDLAHNFERRDAASTCPGTLQKLGEIDDESLRSELVGTLKAVQNMMRNLENGR